jgi:putative transposase
LERWVRFWKSESARHWPRPEEQPLWQRDFWDTQLRPGDDYRAKWRYVSENPIRAKLCASPEEWPFQGEENPLIWTG